MKRNVLGIAVLSFMLAAASGSASAQSTLELIDAAMASDMSTWSFSSSTKKISVDGFNIDFQLDETNRLAMTYYFSYNDDAPEVLTIPETITYSDKEYVVVAMRSPYYTQNKVRKLNLPKTMRRLNENALAYFPNVHEFTIPESVEFMERYVMGSSTNKTLIYKGEVPPTVAGALTSSSYHIKQYVPAKSFKLYKQTDYIEDQCVISDDWDQEGSYTTVNTGVCDDGELGYIVVADALPDVRTYADVNKLIINSGTINNDDWYALRQMHNLIYLDLSGLNIQEVPSGALKDCWQIETVILSDSIRIIRGEAFRNTGIKEIILPEGLTTMSGSYTFYNCDSLTWISFPDSVFSLPSSVCANSDNLKSAKLPKYLATMGSSAFSNCNLDSIVIPGTLAVIPSYAFENNRNLKGIVFGEGIEEIGYQSFEACSSLPAINLPSSVRTIDSYAFLSCSALHDLNLNEGLEKIDSYAFQSCKSLVDITLPSSLLLCLNHPFYDCPAIEKIESRALIPPTVRSCVPTYTARNIEISVPLWSFQEYMTTPGWLEYQEHTKIITDNLPENIYITKDFEFVLTEEQNAENYTPNIRMMQNTEEIDDGFGHVKYERGNLVISSRSKMNVNSFSMYYSPYAKYYADQSRWYASANYDSYRTRYNANAIVVRGEMRAEDQTINLQLRNDLWQFICFPFDVQMSDIVPVDSKTQWVVRYYDGAERAAQNFDSTWKNVDSSETLQAGKGYIMRCYNTSSTSSPYLVEFTVKPVINSVNRQKLFNKDNVDIVLDSNIGEHAQNNSWNLIGNPYPSFYDTRYIDTESPFMVWDSYYKKYVAFSPVDDDYILNPGEAFFIQRPAQSEDGILTFLQGGRQTYRNPNDLTVKEAPSRFGRESKAERLVFNIILSDGESSDRTRIVINESASAGYETNRDAARFAAQSQSVPQIWSVANGVEYAINERPLSDGIAAISLYCATDGLHTISLDTKGMTEGATLEDRVLGISTPLTSDMSYTFNAEAGEIAGRFFISFAGEVTGISAASQDETDAPAYNTAGQRVNPEQSGIIIRNNTKRINR